MKHILVVDDSNTSRASIEYTLKNAGYAAKTAEHGVQALEKLKEMAAAGDQCQLVITDINMPEMDGIALIKKIRSGSAFQFVPIIVITTESEQGKKDEGKEAGATGWIVKPFNPEKLTQVVKKLLG